MRWLKRLGWVVLAVLGLVALLVAGALAYLSSDAGSERVRMELLTRANRALSGTLEVEKLDLSLGRVVVHGVALRTSEGERVAEIERVFTRVALLPLFRRRIELTEVKVFRPRFHLHPAERGLNLTRALKPSRKREKTNDRRRGGLHLSVERFFVAEGQLVFQLNEGGREARLEDISAQGEFELVDGGEAMTSRVTLHAQLAEPPREKVTLEARTRKTKEGYFADVDMSAAGSTLKATAAIRPDGYLRVQLDPLVVSPTLARSLFSPYPLVQPVELRGAMERRGGQATVDLGATAASGHVTVKGTLDLHQRIAMPLAVEARHIDLSEWLDDGPRSNLAFSLRAEGGGRRLSEATGSLVLKAPPSSVGGLPFGPVRLSATAESGTFRLRELFARLPGVRVQASGSLSKERVQLSAQVTAEALADLGATFGKLVRPKGLPLSGEGQLSLEATGVPERPALVVRGQFGTIAFDQVSARKLSLFARFADVTQPLDSQARIEADELEVADRRFHGLRSEWTVADRRLRFDASTGGVARLALAARGQLDPDLRGLTLHRLALSYPQARWQLGAPARVRVEDNRPSPLPSPAGRGSFRLRSGAQMLAVDGTWRGSRLDATLHAKRLRLDLLPHAFLPPWNLAGKLEARLEVHGTLPRPAARIHLALYDAGFRTYRDVDLSLNGRYAEDRFTGALGFAGMGLALSADLDLPVEGLRTGTGGWVHAQVEVSELSLQTAMESLGVEAPLSGSVFGQLRLHGTARAPLLELSMQARSLRYRELPAADASLWVQSDEHGRLWARVTARQDGSDSQARLETPWTLRQLFQKPPSRQQVLRTPLALWLDVRSFALPLGTPGATPRASAQATLQGSLLSPLGSASLQVEQRGLDTEPPLMLRADLDAKPNELSLAAHALRGERSLLKAHGKLAHPLGALFFDERLTETQLQLEAELGPVSLVEVRSLFRARRDSKEELLPFVGIAAGQLTANGSLVAPRIALTASVDGLGQQGGLSAGDIALDYRYANTRHQVDATLRSNGGQLRLFGALILDVSYPALRRGLDWASAPVDASLSANDFQLSFLSGVAPPLLDVGGIVRAGVKVRGPLGAPDVQGMLTLLDGRLALERHGEYRDIQLRLSGDEKGIEVSRLFVRAGGGEATLTGSASRQGPAYALTLKTRLDDFPIVSNDQLVVVLSARAKATGALRPGLVSLTPLSVEEAHLKLPDVRRRDLQALDEPEDIVFVRDGVPVNGPSERRGIGGAGETDTQANERPKALQLRAFVNAPRNVWIESNDVNVELGLSENFRVEVGRQTQVFGTVRVLQGRVEVLGRRFELEEDSFVRFTGPSANPELNVTASHASATTGVTVYISLTGRAKELSITPTSEPPLPETEIYTLLATGRRTLRPGTGGSTTGPTVAASVLGSLAATQLRNALAQAVPLDVLFIEPTGEGTGTRLEAGTYVGTRAYVGFRTELGARPPTVRLENVNEVILQYQLSRRWYLEAAWGDAPVGGADLYWSKEY
ncbi:MAG: translocation/assembly module TamB domain-containing protein [Myxococcota bacterium]